MVKEESKEESSVKAGSKQTKLISCLAYFSV
jgi:hypothetical protein